MIAIRLLKPIHVDKNGGLLQFALKPGQEVKEHSSPSSPVYLLVLKKAKEFLKAAMTLKLSLDRALSLFMM